MNPKISSMLPLYVWIIGGITECGNRNECMVLNDNRLYSNQYVYGYGFNKKKQK